MEQMILLLIWFAIVFLPLFFYWLIGSIIEKRHYRSIVEREARLLPSILTMTVKDVPEGTAVQEAFLAMGATVISSNRFKNFVAALKTIVGGRLRSLETIVDRGRREAILRLLEDAERKGADTVVNLRLETSTISRGAGRQGIPAVEILAYGTALKTTRSI